MFSKLNDLVLRLFKHYELYSNLIDCLFFHSELASFILYDQLDDSRVSKWGNLIPGHEFPDSVEFVWGKDYLSPAAHGNVTNQRDLELELHRIYIFHVLVETGQQVDPITLVFSL